MGHAGIILAELENQEMRQNLIQDWSENDKDKAKKIFTVVDEIHFAEAEAKIHSFCIACGFAFIFLFINLIRQGKNAEIITLSFFFELLLFAAIITVSHKLLYQLFMKFNFAKKLEKAYGEIVSQLGTDTRMREILHVIRTQGILRDRHYGTLILQKMLKEEK